MSRPNPSLLTRRSFLAAPAAAGAAAMVQRRLPAAGGRDGDERPNVLLIAVDDMADWCGCLGGHPDAKTPNIDGLARRGVLFTNAHCTSPICGPSRAAILTGMRPETTGVYTNVGTYVDYVPDAVSLQKHFMAHGYRVMGAGKINHGLGQKIPSDWHEYGPDCGVLGTPFIGDELDTAAMDPTRVIDRDKLKITLPANGGLSRIDRPTNKWDSFDWALLDLPDEDFPDGRIARWGVARLKREMDNPFLLATGFYKPHQPFFAPRKYFEMYDADKIRLPRTIAGDLDDVPRPGRDLALQPWTSGTHKTVTEHGAWRDAVHAYLATVSFADAQVGTLVKALDAGAHRDNTWIVFFSDHGWSLGEKEHWGKHVPWADSTRVPLIVVPPRGQRPKGFTPGTCCPAPVNLLDLYPTLIDACGLAKRKELEGRSLLPRVKDPNASRDEVTVVTIGRGTHAVVDRNRRYVRYFDGSEELYDLRADPDEWSNLAGDPRYKDRKQRMARHIPEDKRIERFVRWGRWKCVFNTDGKILLFDYHGTFGISEQFDVAEKHPDVIDRITRYLAENGITARRVNIPETVER